MVLELGTWNGGGSSMALATGLRDSAAAQGVQKLLVTSEAFPNMYNTARNLLSGFPVRLIHGTSITVEEMPSAAEVEANWGDPATPRHVWEPWLQADLAGMQQFSRPVLRDLCANFSFDLVHIDAGE